MTTPHPPAAPNLAGRSVWVIDTLSRVYQLFHALPEAYTAVGFAHSESILLVVAMINIHHFIVDRYIWRVKRDPGNAAVAES